MLCSKCKTENREDSNFCTHCGEPLRIRPPVKTGKGKWIFVLAGILIFGAGLAYLLKDILAPTRTKRVLHTPTTILPKKTIPDSLEAESKAKIKEEQAKKEEKRVLIPKRVSPKIDEAKKARQLPTGWVVIKNPWGREVSRIPAAVVSGALIALPTQACLGGDIWLFRSGEEDEARIEGGIWQEGDMINIWFLEEGERFEGPELYPWADNEPLEWLSLKSGGHPRTVEISPLRGQGLFMKCSLPKSINEPGVFIQNRRVVGWTFGSWLDGGFLWRGPEGKDLDYEISVENFYIITFANGREEQFSRALVMRNDISALDRLEAFAAGFLLSPKLSRKETPSHLLHEAIIKNMRSLVSQLIEKGFSRDVADILDHHVILEASDPYLLMDVILATAKGYGYESAIQLAEGVGEYIKRDYGRETPQLDRLHSQLYKNWIREFLENEDLRGGWQAFETGSEYFPDDPEIHLLGVELALAGEDWAEAERLLHMRGYPQSLMDRARILAARSSEIKGEEGKIVIRFTPGSGMIPVSAVLNGTIRQGFLVDTGASLVTIPSSTIEALGIEIGANNPRRKTSTIGGVVIAPEVVLSSIELEGWITEDVKALVLDIPNQPRLGLLGLNYLHRFRMELNNKEGVLLLKPR